jgi:hypothetical protein
MVWGPPTPYTVLIVRPTGLSPASRPSGPLPLLLLPPAMRCCSCPWSVALQTAGATPLRFWRTLLWFSDCRGRAAWFTEWSEATRRSSISLLC